MHEKRRRTDNQAVDSMTRALRVLVAITITMIVIITCILAYWRFYPVEPIKTFPKPYHIVFPEDRIVEQGGYITYEFSYEKTGNIIPTIQRKFVDGLEFNVAGNSQPTVTQEGTGTVRVQVHVPETLPPGKYQLQISAKYQMNPIREYHNDSLTEQFEVVSGPRSEAQQDAVDENNKKALEDTP